MTSDRTQTWIAVIMGILFGFTVLIYLYRGAWLDAGIWTTLGVGLALSLTKTTEGWRALPLWRRLLGIVITLVALVLLVVQIVLDFQK